MQVTVTADQLQLQVDPFGLTEVVFQGKLRLGEFELNLNHFGFLQKFFFFEFPVFDDLTVALLLASKRLHEYFALQNSGIRRRRRRFENVERR